MLTEAQLQQIMPKLPLQKLQLYLPHLNHAMLVHEVITPLRVAAFIAKKSGARPPRSCATSHPAIWPSG